MVVRACPVCGVANGACGHQELTKPIVLALGEAPMAETKIYLPAQKTRRGVAGYRGAGIVVVAADGKEDKKASAAAAKAAKKPAGESGDE